MILWTSSVGMNGQTPRTHAISCNYSTRTHARIAPSSAVHRLAYYVFVLPAVAVREAAG